MKILLGWCTNVSTSIQPPLGIGYLAAVARLAGHSVAVMAPSDFTGDAHRFLRCIGIHSPDVVGISFLTPALPKVKTWIAALKAAKPYIATIVGGPHVSALPRFTLDYSGADYALKGEGENVFCQVLEKLAAGQRGGGLAVMDRLDTASDIASAPLIPDLDSIPFPSWDLLQPADYPPTPHGAFFRRFPVAPLVTSRGCAYDCSFCASPGLRMRQVRFRSPQNVLDEIELLVNKYGVREIHFEDENFTFRRDHAQAICEGILSRNIGITWACPNGVRLDSLDKDLLKMMNRSGCHMVGLGIESAHQKLIGGQEKFHLPDELESKIRLIRECGIEACGFFIIGLPGETKKTALDTIGLACRLPLSRAHFSHLVPFPGSRIFSEWIKKNDLSRIPWEQFDEKAKTLWSTDALTTDEIMRLRKKGFRKFYCRPQTIAHLLGEMKLRQIPYLLKRIIAGNF